MLKVYDPDSQYRQFQIPVNNGHLYTYIPTSGVTCSSTKASLLQGTRAVPILVISMPGGIHARTTTLLDFINTQWPEHETPWASDPLPRGMHRLFYQFRSYSTICYSIHSTWTTQWPLCFANNLEFTHWYPYPIPETKYQHSSQKLGYLYWWTLPLVLHLFSIAWAFLLCWSCLIYSHIL